MGNLGSLVADLILRTEQFDAKITKAQSSLTSLERSFASAKSAVLGFGATMAAGLVAEFTIHGLEQVMENMVGIAKAGQRLGVSTEAMSGLAFAAQETHVDVDKLTKGMTLLEVALGKAAAGSKEAQGKFAALGVDFRALVNIPTDQALERIADKISKLPTVAERAAASAEIFGKKVGPDLLNLLDAGGKGIEKLIGEAKELGVTFDELAAERILKAHEATVKLTASVKGLAQEMVGYAAPSITYWGDWLAYAAKARNLIGQGPGPKEEWMDRRLAFLGKKEEKTAATQREFDKPIDSIIGGIGKLESLVGKGIGAAATGLTAVENLPKNGVEFYLKNLFDRPGKEIEAKKQKDDFDKIFGGPQQEFHPGQALERGTAAAFSQERRSQEQNRLFELGQKQLTEQQKHTQSLMSIDQGIKDIAATEVANIA